MLGAAASLACACADPAAIDISLVTSDRLAPASTFTTLRVRVTEETSDRLVKQGTLTMGALGAPAEVFDADGLDVGARYVVTLVADVSTSVCGLGRAVGRSVAFRHRDGAYVVPVQLGCADELNVTRRQPVIGRDAQALVGMPDGSAFVLGGARSGFLVPLRSLDLASEVERYDVATGQFAITASLATARTLPASVALPNGEAAVIGGVLAGITGCANTIEVATSTTTAIVGTLAQTRCLPAAVALPVAERVLVVGGALPIEVYDQTMRSRVGERTPSLALRNLPTAIALSDGQSALVVGGTTAEAPTNGPVAELVRVGGACGDAGCVSEVTGATLPAEGYREMAATWVSCASGGGAVYVLGGVTGLRDADGAIDAVYCYRDVPGVTGSLVAAGTLPARRRSAIAKTIRGPGGTQRVLLTGGFDASAMGRTVTPARDAATFDVDACTCAPIRAGAAAPLRNEDYPGAPLLFAGAGLADGSVLFVGGVRITSLTLAIAGTDDSALFMPDVDE